MKKEIKSNTSSYKIHKLPGYSQGIIDNANHDLGYDYKYYDRFFSNLNRIFLSVRHIIIKH